MSMLWELSVQISLFGNFCRVDILSHVGPKHTRRAHCAVTMTHVHSNSFINQIVTIKKQTKIKHTCAYTHRNFQKVAVCSC